MIGFTKTDHAQLQGLLEAGRAANAACETAVTAFDDAVAIAWEAVADAIADANDAAAAVTAFLEARVADWEDEFGDRSERWQQSDKGEEARQWIDEWDDFARKLEPAAHDAPEPIEIELPDYDALPEEALV
jgi:hypothetical protein